MSESERRKWEQEPFRIAEGRAPVSPGRKRLPYEWVQRSGASSISVRETPPPRNRLFPDFSGHARAALTGLRDISTPVRRGIHQTSMDSLEAEGLVCRDALTFRGNPSFHRRARVGQPAGPDRVLRKRNTNPNRARQ